MCSAPPCSPSPSASPPTASSSASLTSEASAPHARPALLPPHPPACAPPTLRGERAQTARAPHLPLLALPPPNRSPRHPLRPAALHVLSLFLATALAADDVCVVASHYARLGEAQPPLPLAHRLGRTVRDSLGVVAATSLTTASALAANVASRLPLVALFGAFASMVVLALLLLAVLWLPALLLLLDRRHAPRATCVACAPPSALVGCPSCASCVRRASPTPLWSRSARFFGGRYATWLGRRRRLIVAVGLALLLAELGLALCVTPPTGPISAVPPWHNQARYVRQELRMNGDLGKVDLRLVFGLEPLDARDGAWRDGGRLSRDDDARQLRPTGLDVCGEATLPALRRLCLDLEQLEMPHARRDGSSVACPFGHAFAAAAAEASGAAVGSLADYDAPVPRVTCLAAVAALWEKGHGYGVWWSDESEASLPVAIDAWYPTDLSVLLPAHELRPAWDEIKAWLESAAPALASPLFSGGGAWLVMEAREELASTARRGFGASLLLALLAAALVTRSLRVALAATVCVAASALLFLGLQGAAGWPLDVIESVCATVVVGLSTDYTMHVAVAITNSGGHLRPALGLIVPPMVAASLTTAAGGLALTPCTVIFFQRFGAFVLVTSLGALGFAVVLLPALLLCAGAATLEDDAPAVGRGTELQRPSAPAEPTSSSSGTRVEASLPVGGLRAACAVGAWNRLAD